MGRLRKLRIEATESANKVLSEGKIEVKPTKTEDSEQKTEDFGSLQDFYTLIESNRPNTVTEEEKSDEGEFELDYCENCMQMKNHVDGVCQKCKKEKVEETVVTEEMKAVVDKMKYILDYDTTKTREENVNELFGIFDSFAEKDWKKSMDKVIKNFFGGVTPESTGQRKYLEDIWDEANIEYDKQAGGTTSLDVSEIVRKIFSGKTKMHREGTYGRTIDKVIRVANAIKKQKEEENAL